LIKQPPDKNKKEVVATNVAIANALQLEATLATPALSRFNYDNVPSLALLISNCRIVAFLLLIRYFTP